MKRYFLILIIYIAAAYLMLFIYSKFESFFNSVLPVVVIIVFFIFVLYVSVILYVLYKTYFKTDSNLVKECENPICIGQERLFFTKQEKIISKGSKLLQATFPSLICTIMLLLAIPSI